MADLSKIIPVEFYKGYEDKPTAHTVGDLLEQLSRLPACLPVEQGFGAGVKLCVYNIKDGAFLEFEEID